VPRRQPVTRVVDSPDWSSLSTKRRIEQAALQLFAAKGFEATGIRDIADRAGISTAALYHYMGSKDELLIDFMRVSMTQLTRVARQALAAIDGTATDGTATDGTAVDGAANGGAAAELATLVRVHVGFHILDPQRSLVADDELRALSEEAFARVMDLRDAYEKLWSDALERGVRSGTFGISDVRITRLAALEMCNGVARWYSDAGPMQPGQIADAFTDLALAMVGASRGERSLRLDDLRCLPTSEVLALIERELQDGRRGIAEVAAPAAGVALTSTR
jgi:AcrR family transcriptional regulator